MTKALLVLPAGIVTDEGSVTTEVLLLANETTAPPAPAAGLIVTVQVACVPFVIAPIIVDDDREMLVKLPADVDAATVRDAVPDIEPDVACTVAAPAVDPAE
jgi:hypothetical protein